MAIGVWIRHAFNLHHRGVPIGRLWAIPVTAAAAIAAVAVVIRPGASPPATAASVGQGKAVFASAGCGSCHTLRAAGTSGTIGPNLDDLKPSQDAVALQVRNGGGAMPAFRNTLSEQQIAAVAAYVASVAGT
jgi:mono/diheme cytochrome c family protein